MRLIDADAVLDMMNSQMDMQELYLPIQFKELVIDQLPTAYDVDKVVAELEKEKKKHKRLIEYEKKNGTTTEESEQRKSVEVLNRAIQIVKGGGVDGD